MERIKTGVIGLGRMGRHHCRVYASLRESQLIGICDTNPVVANEYSALYEVPVYSDVDELLEQVEAVSIATPTPTHFELVQRCLEHNVHVLVEKPLTESIERARQLAGMVDGAGPMVLVGHIERFNPVYLELKKIMEDMKVLAINFRRLSPYRVSNKDVDVVLDLMIHDLDLCINLTGKEPASIDAVGLTPFSDSLDHVSAQLWYNQGPLITLTASRVTEEKVRCVEVTAEDAFIEADFLHKNIYIHRCSTGEYSANNRSGVKYHQESIIERILVPNAEPLGLEIKHFLDCVCQKCPPCVSVWDGLAALRLAQHIRDVISMHNAQPTLQPALA
jgi:predicted dehydrogenase